MANGTIVYVPVQSSRVKSVQVIFARLLSGRKLIVERLFRSKLIQDAHIWQTVQSNGPGDFNAGLLEIVVGDVRILVVEDELLIRLMLSEVLCDEGFDVTEAVTGDDAIQLLDQGGTFDLLLTDISMSGRADGNAVAAKANS